MPYIGSMKSRQNEFVKYVSFSQKEDRGLMAQLNALAEARKLSVHKLAKLLIIQGMAAMPEFKHIKIGVV
jgi:hypothetical protein